MKNDKIVKNVKATCNSERQPTLVAQFSVVLYWQ